MTPNYPLQWPLNWPRTKNPTWSRFGRGNNKPSIAVACDFLQQELKRLGGTQLVISTNLKYRADGIPYSQQRQPDDQGAAVYFKYNGENMVLACDTFDKIGCNIYAIAKTIEAMRAIERYGASELMKRAFTGFKALPAPDQKVPWYVMLGVPEMASLEEIKAAYRELAKKYHPDVNPSDSDRFSYITAAYNEALTLKL